MLLPQVWGDFELILLIPIFPREGQSEQLRGKGAPTGSMLRLEPTLLIALALKKQGNSYR